MGQMYSVPIDAVASPAAIFDAFELNVASTRAVKIHGIVLGQVSDFGDAQAENLKVQIVTGYTTSGSGGSAPTPEPIGAGPAAASAVETMNTTVANTGTAKIKHTGVFNEAIGYQYLPIPEARIEFAPSTRIVVRVSAPADAITIVGELIFEEIGG